MDGSGRVPPGGSSGRLPPPLAFTAQPDGSSLQVVDARVLFGPARVPVQLGMHRTAFHTLLLISEGEGVHDVDFARLHYAPQTLFWVRPGTVQRFHAAEQTRGRAVLFTAEAAAPDPRVSVLTRASARVGSWRLQGRQAQSLRTLMDLLQRLRDPAARAHALSSLLLEIDHASSVEVGGAEAGDAVFDAFEAVVEDHFASRLTAKQAADLLGWSPRTLVRAVNRAVGATPKAFIDDRVLLEARRALAFTDDSTASIAADLGFNDPSAFGRFFQRLTGTSPGRWRDDRGRAPGEHR